MSEHERQLAAAQAVADRGGDWTNRGLVLRFLIEHGGYTPAQSAGVVGNFMVESTSPVNPAQHQFGGGPGRGIAQWEVGGRFTGLLQLANQMGRPWEDLEVQEAYVLQELHTTHQAADRALRATNDPRAAAVAFEQTYEVAGSPALGVRADDAQEVYGAWLAEYNKLG